MNVCDVSMSEQTKAQAPATNATLLLRLESDPR